MYIPPAPLPPRFRHPCTPGQLTRRRLLTVLSLVVSDQRQISLLVYVTPKAALHQGACRFSQHASRFWQHRRCYWTAAASSNTTCPPRFLDLAPSLEYSRVSKVSKILCSRIQQSSKSWVCSRKSIFKVIVNHLSHEYQV